MNQDHLLLGDCGTHITEQGDYVVNEVEDEEELRTNVLNLDLRCTDNERDVSLRIGLDADGDAFISFVDSNDEEESAVYVLGDQADRLPNFLRCAAQAIEDARG